MYVLKGNHKCSECGTEYEYHAFFPEKNCGIIYIDGDRLSNVVDYNPTNQSGNYSVKVRCPQCGTPEFDLKEVEKV